MENWTGNVGNLRTFLKWSNNLARFFALQFGNGKMTAIQVRVLPVSSFLSIFPQPPIGVLASTRCL